MARRTRWSINLECQRRKSEGRGNNDRSCAYWRSRRSDSKLDLTFNGRSSSRIFSSAGPIEENGSGITDQVIRRRGRSLKRSTCGSLANEQWVNSTRCLVPFVDLWTDAVVSSCHRSFYLSTPSTPLQEIEPFHSSPSFANTATSLHLFFESANVATLQAFNNRGNCLFARFSISPSGNESTSNNPSFTVDEISELNFGIKAVSCTFDEDRTRLAVWERASWKIHVCSLSSSSLSDSPTPLSTIDITPSSNGSTAPTSILFVDESLVLIGSANGRLSLHSLDSLKELASIKVHSDGVSDLRGPQRVKETNRWEIESIGRDGMRKLTEIRKKEEGQYELKVLDERCIAKGTIEKVRASLFILSLDADCSVYLRFSCKKMARFDTSLSLIHELLSSTRSVGSYVHLALNYVTD